MRCCHNSLHSSTLSRSRIWEVFGLVKDRLPVFSDTSDISSLTFDNLAGGRQRQSLVSSSVRSSSQNQSDWQVRVDVLTQQSVPPLLFSPRGHVITSSWQDIIWVRCPRSLSLSPARGVRSVQSVSSVWADDLWTRQTNTNTMRRVSQLFRRCQS